MVLKSKKIWTKNNIQISDYANLLYCLTVECTLWNNIICVGNMEFLSDESCHLRCEFCMERPDTIFYFMRKAFKSFVVSELRTSDLTSFYGVPTARITKIPLETLKEMLIIQWQGNRLTDARRQWCQSGALKLVRVEVYTWMIDADNWRWWKTKNLAYWNFYAPFYVPYFWNVAVINW